MLRGSVSTLATSTPLWRSSVSLIVWWLSSLRTLLIRINSWNIFPLVAGMNMSPVSRLKKTWGKAKTAKFFILEVNTIQPITGKYRTGKNLKLTVYCVLLFALTASDGSYRELLQLQDRPEGGRPSLSDGQQQQRKGEAPRHSPLKAFWIQQVVFISIVHPHACFTSSDCDSLLQSADQRHLLPEWRMCKPAAQWPRQLWGENSLFFFWLWLR